MLFCPLSSSDWFSSLAGIHDTGRWHSIGVSRYHKQTAERDGWRHNAGFTCHLWMRLALYRNHPCPKIGPFSWNKVTFRFVSSGFWRIFHVWVSFMYSVQRIPPMGKRTQCLADDRAAKLQLDALTQVTVALGQLIRNCSMERLLLWTGYRGLYPWG
jgi:hypothetical protein